MGRPTLPLEPWTCPCGVTRMVKHHELRTRRRCSRQCQVTVERARALGSARRVLVDKECETCRATFRPAHRKNRFCSVTCKDESQRGVLRAPDLLPRPCETCGEVFRPHDRKRAGRFCSRSCFFEHHRGENHESWKGGRFVHAHGYVMLNAPGHPKRSQGNYVSEHVLVMEASLGRYLLAGEEVHHMNGVKDDNRIENLELWTKSHPAGQRAVDMLEWARQIIDQYGPEEALLVRTLQEVS